MEISTSISIQILKKSYLQNRLKVETAMTFTQTRQDLLNIEGMFKII